MKYFLLALASANSSLSSLELANNNQMHGMIAQRDDEADTPKEDDVAADGDTTEAKEGGKEEGLKWDGQRPAKENLEIPPHTTTDKA